MASFAPGKGSVGISADLKEKLRNPNMVSFLNEKAGGTLTFTGGLEKIISLAVEDKSNLIEQFEGIRPNDNPTTIWITIEHKAMVREFAQELTTPDETVKIVHVINFIVEHYYKQMEEALLAKSEAA